MQGLLEADVLAGSWSMDEDRVQEEIDAPLNAGMVVGSPDVKKKAQIPIGLSAAVAGL